MRMLILLFLFTFVSLSHAKVVIITNKDSEISQLSKSSIKYLYLAKVNKIEGIKIKPLLSKNKALHKEFITSIIDKDLLQYSSYWARLVFTGKRAIPKRLNKEDIQKELSTLNTIIYIDKEDIQKEWKILYEE